MIEPGQSLGLMIRGGIEYGLGIYVTGVDKDSVADRAGLSVSHFYLNFCPQLKNLVDTNCFNLFFKLKN